MKYFSDSLKNFEDVLEAFIKFKNGGYWIKKIDKKSLDIVEIVNGPYSKKEAEELSKNYVSKYKISNVEIYSKVYNFKQLLLSSSLLDTSYIDRDENNIWKPPKGIFIFAIVHNIVSIAVYKKEDLQDKDFIKFVRYGEINNIKYNTANNYIIFYNSKNTESYIKAKKLYKLIIKNKELNEENLEKIIKLYTYSDEYSQVDIIPNYMSRYVKNCELITLSFFKKFQKEKNPLQAIFNHLKECLNENSVFSQSLDDNSIEISIEVDLIYNDKDYKPKKIYFIYNNKDGQYSFELGNYGGDYSIKLDNNEIKINLPNNREKWNKFIMTKLGTDTKLSNIEKLLSLFLYICKSVGKTKLTINDNRIISCKYGKEELPIYINIIRELAGYKSIYHNLDIYRSNEKEFSQRLNKYKNIKIQELIKDKNLNIDKTISKISKDYLQGHYNYDEICLVISLISTTLYNKIKTCCSDFKVNLKNNNYEFYKKNFL